MILSLPRRALPSLMMTIFIFLPSSSPPLILIPFIAPAHMHAHTLTHARTRCSPSALEAGAVIDALSRRHLVTVAPDDEATAATDVRVSVTRTPQRHAMTSPHKAVTRLISATEPLPLKHITLTEDAVYRCHARNVASGEVIAGVL